MTTATTIAEAARYRAAWTARRRRHRIYYVLLLGQLAVVFATIVAPARLPVSPLGVFIFCVFGMLAATVWLYLFRCPRCGEIFRTPWAQKSRVVKRHGPAACEHCGLAVNEIPAGAT